MEENIWTGTEVFVVGKGVCEGSAKLQLNLSRCAEGHRKNIYATHIYSSP